MKYIFILAYCTLVIGCSTVVCGDKNKWDDLLVEANDRFSKSIYLQNIPCEFYYINVVFKTSVIDTFAVKELHEVLYKENEKKGWPVLMVFDSKDNYLFSHSHKGNIFVQHGD